MIPLGGLRARLLVAFVLVTTVGAALAAWAGYAATRAALVSNAQEQAAEGVRERITAIAPSLSLPPDQATLDHVRDVVGDTVLVTYAQQTAQTDADPAVASAELRRAVAERGELVLQRVEISSRTTALVIGTPIMVTGVDGRRIASGIEVYAVRDLADTQTQIDASARAAALLSALALPLAVLLALVAARGVLRPVRELRDVARKLAKGELSARVVPRGSDELSDLAATVNHMADELQSSVSDLRASEEESRRFVADVSHELRTPLTTLTVVLEVLDAESADLSEDQRTSTRLAVDATRRLTHLVADLMEVSRFDAAAEHLRLEQIEVVAAVRDSLRVRGWTDRVRLEAPGLVPAVLDPRRLDVIVANLVGNALTHGAPPVIVTVGADLDVVTITVTDHGSGLPDTDPGRVFDRFYKGDPGRSRSQGSGLGLAIARAHVVLHGGDLTAENVPGAGARFIARFPTHQEESA